MTALTINGGITVFVDDSDVERVSAFSWCAKPRSDGKGFYVFRNIRVRPGKQRRERLHHFLMDTESGQRVDHVDGNGLNNCRNNLRMATQKQNSRNQRVQVRKIAKASRFKGVVRTPLIHGKYQASKPWMARIRVDGALIRLGYFKHEHNAAQAYNFASDEYFGDFARFNTVPQ